jgi:hypothetical protein
MCYLESIRLNASFLAVQLRTLLPYIYIGIVNIIATICVAPQIENTTSAPSLKSHLVKRKFIAEISGYYRERTKFVQGGNI